jgi:hypothetical protein
MKTVFVGQQEGERVLYEVASHPLHQLIKAAKVLVFAVILVVLFWKISTAMPAWAGYVQMGGLVLGLVVGAIGWMGLAAMDAKSKSYITDRRVVRMSATTPWTVNTRSLSWDEVVKTKTKSAGFLWRMLGVGSVVAHARSTVIPAEGQKSEQIVTNDDIEFTYVIFYQDLGNYMDKVLYLFKNSKKELAVMRPFVAKKRGKRD